MLNQLVNTKLLIQICQRKSKHLKEFHFKELSIYSGSDVFGILLENLIEAAYSCVFVLTDEHTSKHCLPLLQKYLFDINHISIPSGEQHKTLETCKIIWDELVKKNADRNAVLMNLGGGVVGDIGGFCASVYKRGIHFINIPTTLLAMVDSSVGGKTGVDYEHIKNLIGVITQPSRVFINPDLLKTLPDEELRNGYAEMLKHGLIADEEYWHDVRKADYKKVTQIVPLINGSVKIKMKIVKKDPFEMKERKKLNFGHTIGHAFETYSLMNDKVPLKHGEAIAAGMICESFMSRQRTGLSSSELDKICQVILENYPKYSLKNILSPELITIMRQDKKNVNESFRFSLLRGIGKSTVNEVCSESEITAALQFYDSL